MSFVSLDSTDLYFFCLFHLELLNCCDFFFYFAKLHILHCFPIFGLLLSHFFVFNLFHCEIIVLVNTFFCNFYGSFSRGQIIFESSWSYWNTLCSLNHYVCLISWRSKVLAISPLCERIVSLVSGMEKLSRSQGRWLIFLPKSRTSWKSLSNCWFVIWVETYFIGKKTSSSLAFRWMLYFPNFLFVHLWAEHHTQILRIIALSARSLGFLKYAHVEIHITSGLIIFLFLIISISLLQLIPFLQIILINDSPNANEFS